MLVAMLAALAALPSRAAGGDLDTTFSGDGRVRADLGSDDTVNDLAIQPDGKIVAVGVSGFDLAVARFESDGDPDPTFSGDGLKVISFGASSAGRAVAIQPNGRIVVVGWVASGNGDVAIARLRSGGGLDTTFSGDGKATTDLAGGQDQANSVIVLPSGSILVGGYSYDGGQYDLAMVRYAPDGSPDPLFSDDGELMVDLGFDEKIWGMTRQPDGKIVLVGETTSGGDRDFFIGRVGPSGVFDASFSGDGWRAVDLRGSERANAVVIDSDLAILVAGTRFRGSEAFALARLRPRGRLDTKFSGDGRKVMDLSTGADEAYDVGLLSGGRIVVGGYMANDLDKDFAAVVLGPAGALDQSFGSGGISLTDFGFGDDFAYALAVQEDGKIVLGGRANFATEDFGLVRYLAA